MAAAQSREKQSATMSFNNKTGQWTQQFAEKEAKPPIKSDGKMSRFFSPRPSVTQESPYTANTQSAPTPNEVVSMSTTHHDRANVGLSNRPVSSSSESQPTDKEESLKKDKILVNANENCPPNARRAF